MKLSNILDAALNAIRNVFNLDLQAGATPATPDSGFLRVYATTGKKLAIKDDAGTESTLSSFSGAYADLSGKPPISFAQSGLGLKGAVTIDGGTELNSDGGGLLAYGGTAADTRAGTVNTSGGTSANATGGDIDTSGASLPGGNIDTSDGGGAISTRGTGSIQFGDDGTRTTVQGSATANRTQTLPNKDGTFAMLSDITGSDYLEFDAGELIPAVTNGAGSYPNTTGTYDNVNDALSFGNTGGKVYAKKWFPWPTGWATCTATFDWFAGTGTGSVAWGASIRVFADGDALDSASGTAQEVTDAAGTANTIRMTAATSAITPAGTVADRKRALLTIYRDSANGGDDMAADAYLMGVLIRKAS